MGMKKAGNIIQVLIGLTAMLFTEMFGGMAETYAADEKIYG